MCQSVFFFQAEDGIRYYKVTGVQTCALPISSPPRKPLPISMPIRPAPSRPPSNPPARPRPKPPNRPPGCETGGRAAVEGAPGCGIVRLIGAAVVGAGAAGRGAEDARGPIQAQLPR